MLSYLYEPWKLRLTAYGRNVTNSEYKHSRFAIDFGTLDAKAPPANYVVSALRESEEFKSFFAEMMKFSIAPMRMELFTELGGTRELFECYPSGISKGHPSIAPGTQYI